VLSLWLIDGRRCQSYNSLPTNTNHLRCTYELNSGITHINDVRNIRLLLCFCATALIVCIIFIRQELLNILYYSMENMKIYESKKLCSGCHACYSACPNDCITMESDDEGFLYPSINEDCCEHCNECSRVCPIDNPFRINILSAYACVNKDDKIRLNCSSGAVFPAFSEHILNQNGVVFGARFDTAHSVIHDYASNSSDLTFFAGSKYVQSAIGNCYKKTRDFLDKGITVLFSGTPCQIQGLMSYLGNNHEKLYTVDFICHGVPSPKAWSEFSHSLEDQWKSRISSINHRSKNNGWHNFSMKIVFEDGRVYKNNKSEDPYLVSFLSNISLRPSCHSCKFKGLNRASDITIGDFWGVEKMVPGFCDDKGTSLVLLNTEHGISLFNSVQQSFRLHQVNYSEALSYNSAATESVACHPKRGLFFMQLGKKPFNRIVNSLCKPSIYTRVRRLIRKLLVCPLKTVFAFLGKIFA